MLETTLAVARGSRKSDLRVVRIYGLGDRHLYANVRDFGEGPVLACC